MLASDTHALYRRIAELEEEIAHLRRELSREFDPDLAARIQGALGVSPQQGAILAIMYSRTRPFTLDTLEGAAPSLRVDARTPKCLMILISQLRSRLSCPGAIETVRALGYRLSPEGRRLIDAALNMVEAA